MLLVCQMLPLNFYFQLSGHKIFAWSKHDQFWAKFSMSIAKIYEQIYELLWQEPSGLENDLFFFWRKYRICAIWTAIALNRKFLSFRKVENFVNYKVSSYMGDAAKKSSTDIRGRKFHWVLWITPLTGGENISWFFAFPVFSPNYDFGIQMTKHVWVILRCWGNSSMVEGRFSKWF